MNYEVLYNLCMVVSTVVEIYLAFDFYKAFHSIRSIFSKTSSQIFLGLIIVLVNVFINLQNSSLYNFLGTTSLYLLLCIIFVEGNILSRIFHWLLLVVVGMSAEMIFSCLLQISTEDATNKIFNNEFVMISSIITMKLLEFILLMIIKQVSQINVKKVSAKVFASFILIPIATFGIMFLIPYIRDVRKTLSSWDIVLLLFYLLLLTGNIILFYVFTRYSQMLEERMLQQLSKVRYEERKHSYDKAGVLDEQYKERIHNIKYYMKQIGIYLEGGQYRKIADILSELQLGIYKEEKDLICSNRFLNALLVDYRGVAKKNHVQVDIFVEAGFNIEFMKEIDVTSILGNLLDNAMEAAKKCEKGLVSIALYMENSGSLSVCRIENNYMAGELRSEGNKLLTTKENPEWHGIGLQNVKRLVEEYSGYIQQEYEKGVYVTTIILPVQENN